MKWAVLILVPLAACGNTSGNANVDASSGGDGATDGSTTPRCSRGSVFAAPVRLTELGSSGIDASPTLSPDELTIYFHSNRAGGVGGADIYVAKRSSTSQPFGAPTALAGVSSSGDDISPSITADGLFLYLDRNGGTATSWDIWAAQRASTTANFGAPALVASLNSGGAVEEDGQFVLPNHSAMYFISGRSGNLDVYRAARNAGGTFDAATDVMQLSGSSEVSVAVSSDELLMLFASNANANNFEIYQARRSFIDSQWDTPVKQNEVNTTGDERVSWVSADGCHMYMTRTVGTNDTEIFMASRAM